MSRDVTASGETVRWGGRSAEPLYPGSLAGGAGHLTLWRLLVVAAASLVVLVVARELLQWVEAQIVAFDFAYYWPVSVFEPRRPSVLVVLRAVMAAAAFAAALAVALRTAFDPSVVLVTGLTLLVATNAIQGWAAGIAAPVAYDARAGVFVPISTEGEQYYHDAIRIEDPLAFLETFTARQRTLPQHTRTHPPGAVLLFYGLHRLLGDPGLIAVGLGVLSLTLSTAFVGGLLARLSAPSAARFALFLFVLLPAVQIYYLATLDAVAATAIVGALSLFLRAGWPSFFGATVLAWLALFFTFGALFLLPVILGAEIVFERRFHRSFLLAGAVALLYGLLYLLADFNWLASLAIASSVENPNGFRGFDEPVNYTLTRLEGIAEILLFFGPVAGLLLWRAVKSLDLSSRGARLFLLGCGTLLAMLAAGAFRTGETARICLFIYPFLLVPIAHLLSRVQLTRAEQVRAASLVFAQSLLMQTVGIYAW